MATLHELLDACADAVLRPSEGPDIPCSLFTCLAACSVIRDLHDGVALDKTPCGKTVIPVPGVPSDTLVRTTAVIHGVALVRDLTLADLLAVFEGMAILGCDGLDDALMDRLWDLVSETRSLKVLRAHADRLLQHPTYRMPAVRMALRLAPQWKKFSSAFLAAIDMNVNVALYLGKVLTSFFPPALVVRTIVDALPTASATQDTVLRLAGLRDAGACYHPVEVEALLALLVAEFKANQWDPVLRDVFASMLEAHRAYTVVPVSSSTLFGSAISYDKACSASVIVRCPRDLLRMRSTARLTPWLKTEMQYGTGAIHFTIHTWRLDVLPPRSPPRGFQLRVFVEAGDSDRVYEEDVWYVWDQVAFPSAATLTLANATKIVGDPGDVRDVIRRGVEGEVTVKSIRFDLFYEPYSALDEPTLV